MEQEVESVEERGTEKDEGGDGALAPGSLPEVVAATPVVWASPAFLFRLVLSLALLVFPCPAVAARVSSSLSTTHHVHHFHNKHGTVPIAINRMPFLTRGGHGRRPRPQPGHSRCFALASVYLCSSNHVAGFLVMSVDGVLCPPEDSGSIRVFVWMFSGSWSL